MLKLSTNSTMANAKYIPDPSTAESPLNPEELQQIIETLRTTKQKGSGSLADPKVLDHILYRTYNTLVIQRERNILAQKEISRLNTNRPTGLSSTLDARDSVKYLSPEDLKDLFDSTSNKYLNSLDDTIKNLEQQRRLMITVVNSTKDTLIEILEDDSIPSSVRQDIATTAANFMAELTSNYNLVTQVDTNIAESRSFFNNYPAVEEYSGTDEHSDNTASTVEDLFYEPVSRSSDTTSTS